MSKQFVQGTGSTITGVKNSSRVHTVLKAQLDNFTQAKVPLCVFLVCCYLNKKKEATYSDIYEYIVKLAIP